MSVQALSWVFDHSPTRGTERLVMLAIANHAGPITADGTFEAYPGVETIAAEAGLDRTRTAQDALTRLVAAGHLERVINGAPDNRIRKDRRPNLYRILTKGRGVASRHPVAGRHGVSLGGTPSTTPRGDAAPHPAAAQSGVSPGDTPSTERGVAAASNGVSPERSTGCREATPEPSLTVIEPAAASGAGPEPAAGDTPAAAADQRILDAAFVIARRRAARRSDVGPGWVHAAARGIAGDHRAAATRHLTDRPDLTAEQLAELLEPPPAGPATETDELAAQRQAAAARAEETRRRTRDLLTRPTTAGGHLGPGAARAALRRQPAPPPEPADQGGADHA